MSSNIDPAPFDPDRTPRAQIEAAITSLLPCRCGKHPHEIRLVDKLTTVLATLRPGYGQPFADDPPYVNFHATYIDQTGKPLKALFGWQHLEPDQTPRKYFETWLAGCEDDYRCTFGNQMPCRISASIEPPFKSWTIYPRFTPCLQCGLERLDIDPASAFASFDNFEIDQPARQPLLDTCRAFAAAPKGVLLLLGNCGTGKTHLSIAILREMLRRGASDLVFVKHRHFLTQHGLALRPVAFRSQPPESPLAHCRASSLLVYDELTATTGGSASEDALLDLFEHRIGHFKPSVITANVSPDELEAALGSRLYDRLRQAAFAVLEFGFPSKRKTLNADYLHRANTVGGHP